MVRVPAVWADDVPDPEAAQEHVEFGIHVARAGLWAEAAFQFERATRLHPIYAAAFNNLAVAYEQLGRLTEARRLYARALELDPDNRHIRDNRELFLEIDDRRVLEIDDRRERPLARSSAP